MFEKLALMRKRFLELNELIGNSEIVSRQEEWQRYVKEHSQMADVMEVYERYLAVEAELKDLKEMMASAEKEMAEMAENEYYELRDKRDAMANDLKVMLLPKDPMDDKNVVIEIRAGAGGGEAALFAAELSKMYHRLAERLRWKIEDIDVSETELGGVKETVFLIRGQGAYSRLKFESGVHRVQRVPETESQGRVHTSTATVAILPEAEDVDIDISEKDLKIDTYRASGAGGQHVNKTESAIRMTHVPTGIVVECQDERSQIKNREKALRVMKTRLYDYYQSLKDKEYAENRKAQVGTGDRSERIRTYNFPQGRVTDHRIGFTIYSIATFMDGEMFQMLDTLATTAQNEKLAKIDN